MYKHWLDNAHLGLVREPRYPLCSTSTKSPSAISELPSQCCKGRLYHFYKTMNIKPNLFIHFHSTLESKFQRMLMGSLQPTLSPKYFQTDVNIPNPLRQPKQRHLAQHWNFLQQSNSLKLAPNPFLPLTVYLGSSRGFHTVKQESKKFRPERQTLTGHVTELIKTNTHFKLS